MNLEERIGLLSQAATLAQQNGILSLDDAVVVKGALNNIEEKKNIKNSIDLLVKITQIVQSKGIFSLKDAFYMYMAIDGIEELLPKEECEETTEENEKGEE